MVENETHGANVMEKIEVLRGDIVKKTLGETPKTQQVVFVCFDEENFGLYKNELNK